MWLSCRTSRSRPLLCPTASSHRPTRSSYRPRSRGGLPVHRGTASTYPTNAPGLPTSAPHRHRHPRIVTGDNLATDRRRTARCPGIRWIRGRRRPAMQAEGSRRHTIVDILGISRRRGSRNRPRFRQPRRRNACFRAADHRWCRDRTWPHIVITGSYTGRHLTRYRPVRECVLSRGGPRTEQSTNSAHRCRQ